MVRKLSDDEYRLWAGVVRSVRPLHPARASVTPLPADTGTPASAEARAAPRPTAARSVRPDTPSAPALAPLGRRDTRRLVRGHTDIDARLDLHGMTQSEAHAALRAFVSRAQAQGARFVLVITGKGGDGLGRGVLRRQVPLWLQLPEFRACVAGFDAAVGHGGAGALYVRIRRPR